MELTLVDPKQIMLELQKPFPPEDIEWRVGAKNSKENATKGLALAYITNRAIQGRLDDLFGPFGWRNEFREWKGSSQLCGISIRFGDEWVTKWDGADDSAEEAIKGGLSDSMKRAGYQWGIGRYLYKLEPVWAPIKQQGRTYVLVNDPQLPAWALPEGQQPPPQTSKSRSSKQGDEAAILTEIKKIYQELAPDGDLTGFEVFYQGKLNKAKPKAILDWLKQKQQERKVVTS